MKLLYSVIFCLPSFLVLSQSNVNAISLVQYKNENASLLIEHLPNGVYDAFDDFLSKKPSSEGIINLHSNEEKTKFNFYTENNKKVKKSAVVVHENEIYFQANSIMKRLTYDSRNVSWDGGSYFIKGRVVGKFLYFEDYITPETAAFLGGMIATAATRQLKPILFIHHLQKFRVIKNLKHFKTFIDTKYPQYSELVVSKSEMQSNTGQAKVKDVVQLILSQIE